MRRAALSLLLGGMVLLSACGAPAMTPLQVELASATKMSSLKSAKMDLTMLVSSSITTNASTKPTSFTMNMTGSGAFTFNPTAFQMNMNASTAGFSFKTELIALGGKFYIKNPVNGQWTTSDALGVSFNADSFSQADPTQGLQFMKDAKSVTDLGDTTVDNVRTHHYKVVVDPEKILAESKSPITYKDPKLQATAQQAIDAMKNGTFLMEVWIGTSDSYVYRTIVDMTSSSSGITGPSGFSLGGFHVRAQYDIHDFNSPVSITAPI